MLKITLTDGSQFELTLNQEGPFYDFLLRAYKHLQHIDIPKNTKSELIFTKNQQDQFKQLRQNSVTDIVEVGKELFDITVVKDQLLKQEYLNNLHRYYEDNYNTSYNQRWLLFHDLIHKIELLNKPFNEIVSTLCYYEIDYQDLDGKLHYKITDRSIINESVTGFKKGYCYLVWAELGKTPMQYWRDGNSNTDIKHFLETAKPLTYLKPTLCIALEDFEYTVSQNDWEEFNNWFDTLKLSWMKHYNIDKIYENEIRSMNHFHQGIIFEVGKIVEYEQFKLKLKNEFVPTKVRLS